MKWFVNFLFCLCMTQAIGQKMRELETNVENFTTKNGLPNNNINFTFQDQNGFLWVGTWGGLSRFDGYHFYNFFPNPAKKNYFSIGQFTCYLKIRKGIYVLGTLGDGLFLLDCAKNELKKLPNSPKSVNCVVQSSSTVLWVGTLADGYYRYSLTEKESQHFLFSPLQNDFNQDWNNNTVDALGIHPDHPNLLWIGTRKGLYSFDVKSEKRMHYPIQNSKTEMHQYAVNAIKCFNFSDKGKIWTGNFFGGLAEFNLKSKVWKRYFYNPANFAQNVLSDNIVLHILPQGDDKFLLSTSVGPMEFDKTNFSFLRHKMMWENTELKGDVNHLMKDRDGNIWVSQLYQKGLSLVSKNFNSVKLFPLPTQNFQPDYYPSAITDMFFSRIRKSYLVTASNHDGMLEFNQDFTLKKVYSMPSNWENKEPYPTSIAEDSRGEIWLSDITGKILKWNTKTNYFENQDIAEFQYCQKLIRGTANQIFAQTENGLFRLSSEKWIRLLPSYSVFPKEILTNEVVVFQKNNLFAINLQTKEKQFLVQLPKFAIENTNYIHEIFTDSKNQVWIPLEYGGIYRYDRNQKKLTFYNSKKGLTSNNPRRFVEDKKSRLFLICQGGIYFFNDKTNRFVELNRLLKNAASEWHESFISTTIDDQLIVSKNNAFGIINQNYGLSQQEINPIVTSICVNEKNLFNWKKDFIVPNHFNSLKINLSNFNFCQLNEIIFEYQLLPLEKNWKRLEKGRNSIELSNLEEGDHTLLYRLADGTTTKRLAFKIQALWYKSQLFYTLVSVVILLILFAFFRYYLRKKAKERNLEKKVAEFKLKALQAQLNPHFLFNCLTSISGLVKMGEYDRAENTLHDFAKLMRKILLLSDQESIPFQEELELSKLYLNIEKVRKDETFNYSFSTDESLMQFHVPPMTLQPFLENCVKHAFIEKDENDKGFIQVICTVENNQVLIQIVDNGIGWVTETTIANSKHLSKGMSLQKQRLESYFKLKGKKFILCTESSSLGGAAVILNIDV